MGQSLRDARREDRLKGLGASNDAEAIAVLTKLLDRLDGAGDILVGLENHLAAAPDSALARAADLAAYHATDAFDQLESMRRMFTRHQRREGRKT